VEVFRPQHELSSFSLEVGDRTDVARKVVLREALRWQFRALDGVWRVPVVEGGRVIVAARDGRVYALSGREGRVLWTQETRAPNPTDLAVAGEDVLLGVGASGFICLRLSDGAARYFVKTGTRTFVAPGPDGDVMTASLDGVVTRWDGKALAALRPQKKWSVDLRRRTTGLTREWIVRHEDGSATRMGEDGHPFEEKPALAYLVGEDGTVTGAGWKFRADQAVRSAPVEADVDGDGAPDVVFGSDDHRVYVLDARTGRFRWHYQAGNNVAAPVAVADLTGDGLPEIIFATTDGVVRAVSVASR
jgi:outer membrane protein assembly factor BamB